MKKNRGKKRKREKRMKRVNEAERDILKERKKKKGRK